MSCLVGDTISAEVHMSFFSFFLRLFSSEVFEATVGSVIFLIHVCFSICRNRELFISTKNIRLTKFSFHFLCGSSLWSVVRYSVSREINMVSRLSLVWVFIFLSMDSILPVDFPEFEDLLARRQIWFPLLLNWWISTFEVVLKRILVANLVTVTKFEISSFVLQKCTRSSFLCHALTLDSWLCVSLLVRLSRVFFWLSTLIRGLLSPEIVGRVRVREFVGLPTV